MAVQLLQEMCAGNPDMLKSILTRLMHCVSGGISEKFLIMMWLVARIDCFGCLPPAL